MRTATLGLCVAAATATPTKPYPYDVSALPWYYLQKNGPQQWTVTTNAQGSTVKAMARYNASNARLGWDYLHVKTSPQADRSTVGEELWAGGYLEGYLTHKSITAFISTMNTTSKIGKSKTHATPSQKKVLKFFETHVHYMEVQARDAAGQEEDAVFWRMVGNLMMQIEGIRAGYNAAAGKHLTFLDLFLLSYGEELGDIVNKFAPHGVKPPLMMMNGTVNRAEDEFLKRTADNMHCSALIKVTADDLYMAHDTWSGYDTMIHRIYKVYEFNTARKGELAKVSMSSYPGSIASGDDWYMTSHGLGIQETTNCMFDENLSKLMSPESASEFLRVMTATYVATGGAQWADLFATENSGTYNNQYMVVDWKLYAPGQPLLKETLHIAEQTPGRVFTGDVTDVLRRQGYWASYNIPYFKETFQRLGYADMVQKQGSFWSYTEYARPEIFRRNEKSITQMEDMQHMMRYNDYENDVYSKIPNCNGTDPSVCQLHSSMLTIASRGDLMKTYPTKEEMIAHYGPLYVFVAQGCFGATDAKIGRWSSWKNLTGLVISGPTNDQQPTFDWSGGCEGKVPAGSVAKFDFPWVEFTPTL